MTTRCKPGDLAIIVAQHFTPENIGRIVEIVRPAVDGEIFYSVDGGRPIEFIGVKLSWVVRSTTPMQWRGLARHNGFFLEQPIAASHLVPVSGLPVDEDVSEDLRVKEPA